MKTLARLCNSNYKQNRFLKEDPDATAEPLGKKWVSWNKLSSDLQILTHRGDRSIETNDPKSELRNHSSQELIYFTFHSSFLIWEKGEKGGCGGGESYKEGFSMLDWIWKKLDELFQCWKKSICNCKLLCYRPYSKVTFVREFKG